MYSPLITKQTLDRLAPKLSFDLKPRSIAEAKFYVKHFNSLLDDEGQLTRDLKPDEVAYIQSERILCKFDFRYWSPRYGAILSSLDVPNGGAELRPRQFNLAQQIELDVWADMEERGVAIMVMNNKGRQLGLSSVTELAVAQRVLFHKNVNALVAAATPDTTMKMSEMLIRAVNYQPWWLVPEFTVYKTGETRLVVPELKSSVTLQHGAQYTGLARGDTPTVAHLSECSSFNDPDEDIDSALLFAMHEDPKTFLVLESTAMILGDWWNKKWNYYVEAWPKGEGRLRPIFLPFFLGGDIYPTKNWLRGHPVPVDWQPPDDVKRHAVRAREVVEHDSFLNKYLGRDWEMPTIQMWDFHCRMAEARAMGKLNTFLREIPTTAQEAFQTANTTVFDIEVINELDSLRSKLVYGYGLEARGLHRQFWPDSRDKIEGSEPVRLRTEWADPVQDFILHPLKLDGYPSSCPFENRIFIWELPRRGFEYYIGVDTAYGLNQDRCVIEVVKKGDVTWPAVQVAEYASGYIDAVNLSYVLAALATLYTVSGDPRLVIECRGPGDRTQDAMKMWGWGNFHVWERYDKKRRQKSNTIGWYTNSWSRDSLVVELNKAIRDGDVQINSPWLIHELRTLSKDAERQSIRAESGMHDDRYMAFGMAYFSAHCWEAKMGREDHTFADQRRLDGLNTRSKSPNEIWEERWKRGEHLFNFGPQIDEQVGIVRTMEDLVPADDSYNGW